jgi:hypothetical protein
MKVVLFILSFFCSYRGASQNCMVYTDHGNILYINAPNSLYLNLTGKRCEYYKVTADNGRIEKTTESCNYVIYPLKTGVANITITDERSQMVLSTAAFTVKDIPEPVAIVAEQHGGDVKKAVLKVQTGIYPRRSVFDGRLAITNYTVTITRAHQNIFSKVCSGPGFPSEVINSFEGLQPGDRVLFSDMNYKSADGSTKLLQPVEFRVIE